MAEIWALTERERLRRVPHPPSPVAQPPQALGQLPFLCSENLPGASSHIPCSASFSTLGVLKVDLAPGPFHLCPFWDRHPLSAATICANACPSHRKAAVAWKSAAELSQALWESKKKICRWHLLCHFCLLTILHHSSRHPHLPFGQIPVCWREVTIHSRSCWMQQQWIWDMWLSSSKVDALSVSDVGAGGANAHGMEAVPWEPGYSLCSNPYCLPSGILFGTHSFFLSLSFSPLPILWSPNITLVSSCCSPLNVADDGFCCLQPWIQTDFVLGIIRGSEL